MVNNCTQTSISQKVTAILKKKGVIWKSPLLFDKRSYFLVGRRKLDDVLTRCDQRLTIPNFSFKNGRNIYVYILVRGKGEPDKAFPEETSAYGHECTLC